MSGAAKSNVLMFLAAMCALGTLWIGVVAVTQASPLYGLIALLLAVATVVSFRAYRAVLRQMDEAEGRT